MTSTRLHVDGAAVTRDTLAELGGALRDRFDQPPDDDGVDHPDAQPILGALGRFLEEWARS